MSSLSSMENQRFHVYPNKLNVMYSSVQSSHHTFPILLWIAWPSSYPCPTMWFEWKLPNKDCLSSGPSPTLVPPAPSHSEVCQGPSWDWLSCCWEGKALPPCVWSYRLESKPSHYLLFLWMELGTLRLMTLKEKLGELWTQSNLCFLASLSFPQFSFETSKLPIFVWVSLSWVSGAPGKVWHLRTSSWGLKKKK